MAAKFPKVDPFDLVVFGGTGDLAYRKLYPALFHRDMSEQLTDPTRIIGVSRRPMTVDAFRRSVHEALTKYNEADANCGDGSLHASARSSRGRRHAATRVGATSRSCSARTSAPAPITWRPAPICSVRSPSVWAPRAWRRRVRGSSWKSRSAGTARARRRSTTRSAPSSRKRASSASTIISARSRCRT